MSDNKIPMVDCYLAALDEVARNLIQAEAGMKDEQASEHDRRVDTYIYFAWEGRASQIADLFVTEVMRESMEADASSVVAAPALRIIFDKDAKKDAPRG